MRWNVTLLPMALAMALAATSIPCAGATFGTVVPIVGHASDIALDQSRGVLYIANYTANRIEVMNTADGSIRSSINVAPGPGSLALSPDSQFLVVTHYANTSAADKTQNLITVVNLNSNARQTFYTGDPPLGVAFTAPMQTTYGQALIVTTTSFILFDPSSGWMKLLTTFANEAMDLPAASGTFPGQILETAMATSGDGQVVWGIGSAGTGTQIVFRYVSGHDVQVFGYVSSPTLLPRVSVSRDGGSAMIGYCLIQGYKPERMNGTVQGAVLGGRYPGVIESPNITGHAIDSAKGIIYGQFPDVSQPAGPPLASSTQPAGQTSSVVLPALLVMDADNLNVRERLFIPENMVGRAVLNSSGSVLYAISDSGVMILPVGSLNQYPRVVSNQEDVLAETNFCNRSTTTQTLTIQDPGGGRTDFTITPTQSGVTVSPSSGQTPATVQVRVDPSVFQGSTGTTAITLNITSKTAINQPRPVRLLMNNPDADQRGTLVNVPGVLTDILADPSRNRYYVLRQDANQLLIFDGGTNQLVTVLKTATSPTTMAMSIDRRFLLVGHNDSQLVMLYDLDALQPLDPVILPGGHYGRSIAASNGALLVLARDEGPHGEAAVDSIDLASRVAWMLPTLGVWENKVSPQGVLSPSPNGRSILLAGPNGALMLYSADADTFTVSRKDFTALGGAYAASSYDSYVVGNKVLNASLVPVGTFNVTPGATSGFTFTDRGGYLATNTSAAGAGVVQSVPDVAGIASMALASGAARPVRIREAPLLPATGASSSSGTGSIGMSLGTAGTGAGSIDAHSQTAFTRTVAPLPSAGTVVVLTVSGVTVLSGNYDASVAPPSIAAVVNAADGKQPVAPGGLISVYGQQMSPVNVATSQIPLPTALGDSCVSVNGTPVPLLYVSSQQINAQLPFNVNGNATLSVHTPGGVSNNYYFTVTPAAPSIFRSGAAGPMTTLATVVRNDNGQFVTPTNPLHIGDWFTIYLTGMGATTPSVDAGLPAPSSPLAYAAIQPAVSLGGTPLEVSYAGLAPGEVGVYQINAKVNLGTPQGLAVPLTIGQGAGTTEVDVRVVK